jgi:flagellar biosynthesis protein FlhF
MRLRTISARTVKAAMESVRAACGEDAVIVHMDERRGIVKLTVAIDDEKAPVEQAAECETQASAEAMDQLPALLRYHGVPSSVATRIAELASNHAQLGLHEALGNALDQLFQFRPLTAQVEKNLLLVGQAGQGKSLATVRLAHMALRQDRAVRIITLDAGSAGAMAQMEAFCKPLELPLVGTTNVNDVQALCAQKFDGLTLIDSPGINPFALEDVQAMAALPLKLKAEPVWVFAANSDAQDVAEMGEIFASMGVQRFIASRADASRRFASVLAVMARCQLRLAGLSASPWLSDPLVPGTAVALASRLVDRPDPAALSRYMKAEAA